jgi:hypothetical protein
MDELDDVWSRMLKNALETARTGGRHDVADYLELKAGNDAIRRAGIRWLLDSFIEVAATEESARLGIEIERTDPHNFSHLGANLVGWRLSLRRGVRCLSIEAGWTRTPSDGFMRGGAMAVAKLTHFGMPKQNSVLNLVATEGFPVWKEHGASREAPPVSAEDLLRHFRLLID